jgi:hypothetical protein
MILIHYPPHQYKIREPTLKKEEIWDDVRRQWVSLTPEEWVRQNFLQFLIQVKKYPASYIVAERRILIADVKKRFDILVYNKLAKPWLMIECKKTSTPLDKKVLRQILNYNIAVPVPYLVITNGETCYGYHRKETGLEELTQLPDFE